MHLVREFDCCQVCLYIICPHAFMRICLLFVLLLGTSSCFKCCAQVPELLVWSEHFREAHHVLDMACIWYTDVTVAPYTCSYISLVALRICLLGALQLTVVSTICGCCTQVPELLVWTERFREWFATQLLAPLSLLMDTAHEEPNAHMARLVPGQQAPQLPPITQLLEVETDASGSGANSSSNAISSAAGGAAGIAGGLGGSGLGLGSGFGPMLRVQGGGMGSGSSVSAVEDARNMAQNLMESLRHSQLPYGYDPQPLLMVSCCGVCRDEVGMRLAVPVLRSLQSQCS